MAKKRSLNLDQRQEFVQSVVDSVPEGIKDLSLLGVMKWGGEAVLKHAVIAEINEFLGTQPYQRLGDGIEGRGERNGFRRAVIDTPVGQVEYDRQRLVNAPGFQSKLHTPYMVHRHTAPH